MKALLLALSMLVAWAPGVALAAWPAPSGAEPASSLQAPWHLEPEGDEAGTCSPSAAAEATAACAPDAVLPGLARTLDEACRQAVVSPAALPACVWTGAVGAWQSGELTIAADAPAPAHRWTDHVPLGVATVLFMVLLRAGAGSPGRHRRRRRVWPSVIRRRRPGGVPATAGCLCSTAVAGSARRAPWALE
ncbi:hypothetical protein [Azohydromonas aeria]|uniref:hypothetical protein n=1 Tax=Azohydromonas aeria TaxID=2590212 RepID=UPI0012F92916|nr:hypothetical protein [Azohydromonas aeria]